MHCSSHSTELGQAHAHGAWRAAHHLAEGLIRLVTPELRRPATQAHHWPPPLPVQHAAPSASLRLPPARRQWRRRLTLPPLRECSTRGETQTPPHCLATTAWQPLDAADGPGGSGKWR